MPRVALAGKHKDKIDLLNDIYQTYLLRDVKAYVKNEDAVSFKNIDKSGLEEPPPNN